MAHASESGLQAHSIGPDFPWLIVGTEDAEHNTRWYAWNTITGDRYPTRDTYRRAEVDAAAHRIADRICNALGLVATPAYCAPHPQL